MAARKFEQWPDEAIGLLGAVLDCLPQSIAVLDQSGRIVTVNQAWIDSACSNGAPPDAEWIGVDYLAACRSVERNAQKGASSSCDAIRDVLAESEKRFRATFEQAAVGIAHVASDGRFLRINRKFCDIVGYSPKEMQERTFRDITLMISMPSWSSWGGCSRVRNPPALWSKGILARVAALSGQISRSLWCATRPGILTIWSRLSKTSPSAKQLKCGFARLRSGCGRWPSS
jgi:hypothetical protein